MKNLALLITFALGILLISCEKNDEIYYPPTGSHGPNLLVKSATSSVTAGETFSVRADLSKQSKLKLVLTDISNYTGPSANAPKWLISGENNWTVSSFDSYVQEIEATKRVTKADLAIQFLNSPGSVRIEFYENSTQITKSIIVNW
jgi:hypothetical protein